MRIPSWIGIFFLASGCIVASPSGIWMIQYTPEEAEEDPCSTGGTENFELASFPPGSTGATDSDWVYTESHTSSDVLYFVQIETTLSGEAVLLNGVSAYPGVREGKAWTFSWESAESLAESAEHTDGYSYDVSSSTSSATTITFEPAGDVAVGTQDGSAADSSSYTETDEWDVDDNNVYSGQIPASAFLEWDENDPGVPTNEPDVDDCNTDACQLTLTTTCEVSLGFTAVRTDYSDEDAYQYLMAAGQN
jgi:hypothetical protein